MGMYEIDEAAKTITEAADPECNIIFGAIVDESMSGEIKITVIATGFESGMEKQTHSKKMSNPVSSNKSFGPFVRKPIGRNFAEFDNNTQSNNEKEENEELDVPAFIRRKLK
jgi:cell division protein FtsZ